MGPDPGLCGGCRHARVVTNRRGSRFWLCGRSRTDPGFRRYPVLPVVRCRGFEAGEPGGGGSDSESETDSVTHSDSERE